jgi:hypothetical protein
MFAGMTVPKLSHLPIINCFRNSFRNKMKIMITGLLFICLGFFLSFTMEIHTKDSTADTRSEVPLLLNVGEIEAMEAEVGILLWFKNGDVPHGTMTNLPLSDWTWTYNELQAGNKKVVATLSGHRVINKDEEKKIYEWYITMEQELAKTGGLIYIDERIDQTMDISAYLSKTNAQPAQWTLIGNMLSIAAYQKNFLTSVLAGRDRINLQLLSRGKNNEGQTVLAIPALLKEF